AQLYFFTGDLKKSVPLYRELLALEPDNPDVLQQLGLLLMRRAELLNCTLQRACIYPLPRAHTDPDAAAEANALFERAAQHNDRWILKWLVHLSKMAKGEAVTPFDFVQRASAG